MTKIIGIFIMIVCVFLPCSGNVKTSRTITRLGSAGPGGPDTLETKLLFFAEGNYDTLWQIDTIFDTTRIPLDIILAIDLSLSMSWIDSLENTSRWPRIVWAKLAALKFFDSLTNVDRVSVMGWTAVGSGSTLSDTANAGVYYQKWLSFTSSFDQVRSFIRDSIFIDGTGKYSDTFNGTKLLIRDNIPKGNFTSTPLRISSICAMQRLANFGRPETVKALIMLTDGENNDGMKINTTVRIIDSLRQQKDIQYFGIGFMAGDTAELRSLSGAGGGDFYNATNPAELDSAYAKLARQLIDVRIDTSFSMRPVAIRPDTVLVPNDVVLALDLSGSMGSTDGSGHFRLSWAKIAALGFLDSLKNDDRVAILGWTGRNAITLSDTLSPASYYKIWYDFTSPTSNAQEFICNDIFIDGSLTRDSIDGRGMVIMNQIPSGAFGNTPLHISSIVASSYLSQYGRQEANKVVIMLTDGQNNDDVSLSFTTNYLDSLKRTQGIQFHTIGFMDGNVTELEALALAGGGVFFNAKSSLELQNAYASLANMMVLEKIAAHKLTIQEVLQTPPLYYIDGSQRTTDSSSITAQSFDKFQDTNGNAVLRWNFKKIRYWAKAEVSYRMVAINGGYPMIGVDSVHATTGFWSNMSYTDENYVPVTINLQPSGGSTPSIGKPPASARSLLVRFSEKSRSVSILTKDKMNIGMRVFSVSGKTVCQVNDILLFGNTWTDVSLPSHLSPGVYFTSIFSKNTEVRYTICITR